MQALWMEYERNSVKHHLTYKFITQNNDLAWAGYKKGTNNQGGDHDVKNFRENRSSCYHVICETGRFGCNDRVWCLVYMSFIAIQIGSTATVL